MLGVTPNQLIDMFDVLHCACHKLPGEVRNRRRFILSFEETRGDLIDAVARDIPLKQHLKRVFSRFASWSHFVMPGPPAGLLSALLPFGSLLEGIRPVPPHHQISRST